VRNTTGMPISSTALNTAVSHGPRNGLRQKPRRNGPDGGSATMRASFFVGTLPQVIGRSTRESALRHVDHWSGLTHFRLGNLAKSVSLECISPWCSMA
jgi:hypothetical protein